jgi:hypothetical protein
MCVRIQSVRTYAAGGLVCGPGVASNSAKFAPISCKEMGKNVAGRAPAYLGRSVVRS